MMKSILLFLKTADRECFFPGPPIISCLCTRTLPLTVILPYQMCMSILFSGNNLSIVLYLSHESGNSEILVSHTKVSGYVY